MPSDAVIFDLGGVVLSWDPRKAYERVLPAEEGSQELESVTIHLRHTWFHHPVRHGT